MVIKALSFWTTDYSGELRAETHRKLFQLRLAHYLLGCGHPDHPRIRGVFVTESEFRDKKDDHRLRAHLFLKSMMASDLVPNDPYWKLTVSVLSTPLLSLFGLSKLLLDTLASQAYLFTSMGPKMVLRTGQHSKSDIFLMPSIHYVVLPSLHLTYWMIHHFSSTHVTMPVISSSTML